MAKIGGAAPKHNYDSEDFYLAIEALATRGYYDGEIADELNLTYESFSKMKNGNYHGWNEQQNAERSKKIRDTLAKARRKTNSLVRSTYLKIALGAKKLVNTTRRYIEDRCECGGQDPMCPYCGGTGKVVTEKSIIQETEAEMPPNIQALATWLHHHDPEWVSTENGATETADVKETHKGIDIVEWISAMTTDKNLLTEQQKKALKDNEKAE